MSDTRSNITSAVQMSIRAASAAGFAVAIAHFVGLQFPIYALISAILVTDLSASRTRQLGLPRLAGTVLGATVGAIISISLAPILNVNSLLVGLGIITAMLLSHFLRMKDAAKIAGYVCGVVLLDHSDRPWIYALHRTMETSLGIGMAVLVSLVPKLLTVDELKPQDS